MADHIAMQIRDALVAQIATVSSLAGRVYFDENIPLQSADLPQAQIRYEQDDAQVASLGWPSLEELAMQFAVDLLATDITDAEKIAHNLRRDVEAVLLGSVAGKTLNGKAIQIMRTGVVGTYSTIGDMRVYQLEIKLQIDVRHLESQPDSFIY